MSLKNVSIDTGRELLDSHRRFKNIDETLRSGVADVEEVNEYIDAQKELGEVVSKARAEREG